MTDALRVLHINAGNLYGGVETFLSTVAECRDLAPGMLPEFALCFAGRQEDELKASGAAVHRLGEVRFSRPWTVWRARDALGRLLAAHPFDIVVCHQPWTQALFGKLIRRHGKAYVAYFHGPAGDGWPERRSRRTDPHLVIAPSRHSLGTVSQWYPRAVQAVLNYPLPSRFRNRAELLPEERVRLRAQFGAGPEDAVVFQASRVEMWKGPDLVIRALGQLRDIPGWRFWFAGEPQRPKEQELFDEMKRLSHEAGIHDRVQFLGARTDVPMLMQAADIYTQGNRGAEGFSLSFLEASYSSLPIVTSDLGGAAEMIDETNGVLVPAENVEALSDGLRRLIVDGPQRVAMGRRGREKAIALCDTATQLNRLAGYFADAAKGRP